eukprot:COSAG02_NODE_57312_length_281_cov_0.576923_1_plen_40_part_10
MRRDGLLATARGIAASGVPTVLRLRLRLLLRLLHSLCRQN